MSRERRHPMRPKGFVRRSALMMEVRPRGTNRAQRLAELDTRITATNLGILKWRRVAEATDTAFYNYVKKYTSYSLELERGAVRLMRRRLIAEKRLAPFLRKNILLNAFRIIEQQEPTPRGEKAVWGQVERLLKTFEKEEATTNTLLKDPAALWEYTKGAIIRLMRW